MSKRPITFSYLLFYILFLPDTWQALMGLVAAYFVVPVITAPGDSNAKIVVVFIMLATIGYVGTRPIAKGITRLLKKFILGDKI